jgi:hypothetical protein
MGFFINDVNFDNLVEDVDDEEGEKKSLVETSAVHLKELRNSVNPNFVEVKRGTKANVRQTAMFDLFKEVNKTFN